MAGICRQSNFSQLKAHNELLERLGYLPGHQRGKVFAFVSAKNDWDADFFVLFSCGSLLPLSELVGKACGS